MLAPTRPDSPQLSIDADSLSVMVEAVAGLPACEEAKRVRVGQYAGKRAVLRIIRIILYCVLIRAVLSGGIIQDFRSVTAGLYKRFAVITSGKSGGPVSELRWLAAAAQRFLWRRLAWALAPTTSLTVQQDQSTARITAPPRPALPAPPAPPQEGSPEDSPLMLM